MSGSIQPANLLQPYCNLADTGGYALDKAIPPDLQKPPKQAQFPDAVGRAGTSASKLVMSRGKRFESARRLFFVKTCKVVDNVMGLVHLWCITILLRHLLPQFR